MKKLLVILGALLVLGGSASAYAWWDTLQQTSNETITIGEGVTLNVNATATVPAGKVLVPAGVVLKANDVESVVLTYDVFLDFAATSDLPLTVTASNILINGSATNAGLVNVNISLAQNVVNSTAVVATVTVTLTEPTTEAEYLAIANQDITFTLTFTATN